MKFILLVGGIFLTSCGFAPTHSNDAKSCRERAAYNIIDVYPDPDLLAKAIDTICLGTTDITIFRSTTTTSIVAG